jgi:hypothetical protein
VRRKFAESTNPDALQFPQKLNSKLSAAESAGEKIRSAGIPEFMKERESLVSTDCVKA